MADANRVGSLLTVAEQPKYLTNCQSIYQPLSNDQFRLLRLAPGLPADRIFSSLETHLLPSLEFEFEALSYTWGSTENNVEIYLGDHPVPVTRNLFEALQALRF